MKMPPKKRSAKKTKYGEEKSAKSSAPLSGGGKRRKEVDVNEAGGRKKRLTEPEGGPGIVPVEVLWTVDLDMQPTMLTVGEYITALGVLKGEHPIIQYKIHAHREILVEHQRVALLESECEDYQWGMVEVDLVLKYKTCLALSLSHRLQFRPLEDLSEILYNYELAPRRPTALCRMTSTQILLEDRRYTDTPSGVMKFNGRQSFTQVPRAMMTLPAGMYLGRMCYVEDNSKKRLVGLADRDLIDGHGVRSYNLNTGKLVWEVKESPSGEKFENPVSITTDGRGSIFITEQQNNAIRMLRSDGEYLGILQGKSFSSALGNTWREFLGIPWEIAWCEKTTCLILCHAHHSGHKMSAIRLVNQD